MQARGISLVCAGFAVLALSGCGDHGAGKTEASSAERIAAALDTCAEGRGAFARHLCANHELAALDGEVRHTLVAQAAEVSDAGAQLLVRNQTRWLEAQRISCGIVDPDAAPTAEQQTCLQSELRARAREAGTAVQQLGGYTFQRMELVDATPVTAALAQATGMGDAAPHAIIRDIRFPRIDGQQTPEIQRFNDLVAQDPQFRLEDATNEVVDYHIAFAGPELVSVRFDLSSDTLGAAHPSSTSRAVTVVMSDGHALTAEDVFRPDSGWERFLTQRAVAEISRQYREDGFTPPERDVQESATKPHLWLITEGGLTILFPPYSFGAPYVMGGTEVSIPWRDLRPYLKPGAPAPIRPAA
jgi:uncharacterized protein YecT (DUF1311 family)